MKLTTLIRKYLAEGAATATEILCRFEDDPIAADRLRHVKNPVSAIAQSLRNNDIQRNDYGWCIEVARRPYRYALVDQLCNAPQCDLNVYVGPLKDFLFTHLDCAQVGSIEPCSGAGHLLPHIIGSDRVLGRNHCPSKITACLMVPHLTVYNFSCIIMNTAYRTHWANRAYVVTPRINDDCANDPYLELLSATVGVGVLRVGLEDLPPPTAIILPAQQRDRYDADYLISLSQHAEVLKGYF